MNILLAGDSWGMPNYCGPPGVPPQYHLQYLLQDAGHRVVNASKNGGSNLEALDRIHNFYTDEEYIVWFHTSPLRDYMPSYEFKDDMYIPKDYYNKVNACIKDIISKYSVKFIAIGGCTTLSNYLNTEHLHYYIKDWKSEILGKQLPEAIWWGCMNYPITTNKYQEAEIMIDEISNSKDFPDNGHPGIRPHAELMQRLTKEVFEKTINSNY